jgi:3-hydroxyacyl-CoA dehydrogenase
MNTVDKAAVVGAGMMGAEIALSFSLHGTSVLLKDINMDVSEAGKC